MNPSTLFGMLIGDLYYGKRNSKAEDGILGMNVKKRTWFKEKQFRSHWGEKTCFLAFKIQVFPCPVRSLCLLPNFKNVSVSEALCKLMQTWMFWTFCLFSVELASQKMVGKLPQIKQHFMQQILTIFWFLKI